jgi:hypothetical protein
MLTSEMIANIIAIKAATNIPPIQFIGLPPSG